MEGHPKLSQLKISTLSFEQQYRDIHKDKEKQARAIESFLRNIIAYVMELNDRVESLEKEVKKLKQ